ncbi:MAG: efflux RND transporter periplasmic adaptor subunit [Kiritimatiellae bacterium]|nr:efflux RND transporter periplasmic adaptor subunit [Kiritimatiellia bacterium]MDD5523091.1 efflux RND transporter periplasmic adaptor subunit [Kiritimatiellia bacterium]
MNKKSSIYGIGRLSSVIVGLLVVGLTLSGCGKKGGPPQGGVPEVAVVTIQPERLTLNTELPGRVSAFLVAEVRPQVSGIIQKRLFEEGGDVKAGDKLYQIDPAMYKAAHSGAKAALSRAEANLTSIRLRAQRYKELVAVKAVSKQDYDDITAALKQVEAEVEAGKAAVESARINLAYTSITAPISGRIGKSLVTIGALATAHQGYPFAVIQQLDPVYVDVPQSSVSLLRLKAELASGNLKPDRDNRAKVKLVLGDGKPYPLEGTLKFSDVTVDSSTGSFILRVVVPNPDHTLLPGMFVRATIEEGVNEQALLVPQQGMTQDPKGNPMALIVGAEDKVEVRMLTLDRTVGNRWLVSSGIKPGDRMIVEGIQKVRPGASVKAVPFNPDQKSSSEAAKPAKPAGKAK